MNKLVYTICDALGISGTAILISLEGWDYIFSIICSCLVGLTLLVSLVFKIMDKIKKAKEDDGKVSIEEAKQIYEDVKPDVEQLVDQINEIKDDIKKDK